MKRLWGCQGSIQLVTGLAAARKTSVIPQNSSVDNYLVIYQTMAPESQCAEFVQAIERMAGALEAWHKIVYLNNEDMLYLQELWQLGSKNRG